MNARSKGAIVAGVAGGILLASHLLHSVDGGPVLCLFRGITGLPCPSCGMTRAFVSLGHGDLHSAVQSNLASPAAYLATWLIFMLGIGEMILDYPLRNPIWDVTQRQIFILTIFLMSTAWIMNLMHAFGV
jgi:hypothetical protein